MIYSFTRVDTERIKTQGDRPCVISAGHAGMVTQGLSRRFGLLFCVKVLTPSFKGAHHSLGHLTFESACQVVVERIPEGKVYLPKFLKRQCYSQFI